MTTEKLKALEPIFGAWYVDSKLAEGKNSRVFRVYKTVDGVTEFLALKAVKFPANEKELSKVIESGKYKTVGEYLETLEEAVTENMNKMLSLRTNENIVRFDNFQIVKESSCFYVIMLMELLHPFSEKVKVSEFTTEKAIKIGCDLCYALEGFRELGIMHHQIKPENIYVDHKGNFKLGDFGISNIAGRMKTEASPYMAPEVYKESSYDTTSDIYSVGILLYKLLNNNRLPFLPEYPSPVSLSDREAAFEKQLKGNIPHPPKKADSGLAKIISKAIAYAPTDRYFNPLLMRTDLERYAEALSAPKTEDISSHEPAPVPQAPVYVPLQAGIPLSAFELADEEDEEPSVYLNPDAAVSEAEKVRFREAFKEDADEEDDDDGKDNKKLYILVAVLIAVLAIILGILFFAGGDENTTTKPSVVLPTVSTTVAPTAPTTVPPTVAPTTTTVPTTTEPTTTAPTTTEPTTAEPTTTEPATTEPTTTQSNVIPEFVTSDYSDGDTSADGKTYTALEEYTLISSPDNEFFDEVIIEIATPLGENIVSAENVYIYETVGSSVIQKITARLSIELTEDEGESIVCCYITVDDGDFYYTPEYYDYFVCFEEGALTSDNAISLPLQLQV